VPKKNIAVVLTGSGFKDGTAITEAVSTLIALSSSEANYQCFAPDKSVPVVDHRTDSSLGTRSILAESARITRGPVTPLRELNSGNFDGLVFPGGFGAALHLCDWASKGHKASTNEEVKRIINSFYEEQKPIGAICIAPALVSLVLGKKNISLTIGNDKETLKEIEKTGSTHEVCSVDDFITDRENRIVSTPAYMYGEAKPHEVFNGISAMIRELVEMA